MSVQESSYEAPVWAGVEGQWKTLFGSFADMGVSVEWHDFECGKTLDWSQSFHPESLEICLNFDGCGTIRSSASQTTVINPQTVAHYAVERDGLPADRHAGQKHRFMTIEMSRPWLAEAVKGFEDGLNRETRSFLDGSPTRGKRSRGFSLNSRVKRTAEEMLQPPFSGLAANFWFKAKVLEIASHTLQDASAELFCQRQKRLAMDRVDRVKQALARDLEHPPTLSILAKEVGCSSFYLSRIFSDNTGMTISRYLRNLRLERAAELLRAGDCNVTEAALSVGYSSLSHFSKAFAEMFGACPCVFPLKDRKK